MVRVVGVYFLVVIWHEIYCTLPPSYICWPADVECTFTSLAGSFHKSYYQDSQPTDGSPIYNSYRMCNSDYKRHAIFIRGSKRGRKMSVPPLSSRSSWLSSSLPPFHWLAMWLFIAATIISRSLVSQSVCLISFSHTVVKTWPANFKGVLPFNRIYLRLIALPQSFWRRVLPSSSSSFSSPSSFLNQLSIR